MDIGILTIIPAILVIFSALLTRRTIESLFLGVITSYILIGINTQSNPVKLLVDSFFSVVTDYDTMWLVIVCGLFGSLIAVVNASGGSKAIAKYLGKICKTGKATLFVSWILGIIIFVDDYMNIMTITSCMRDLSDQRKNPREALAYVVDSTGAPVCVLLPFSTWAIFFAGVFYKYDEIVDLGYKSAIKTYIHTIPFMFYAIIAMIIVPLFIIGILPKIGAMKKAYQRVETTGEVYSKESEKYNKVCEDSENSKSSLMDFAVPIATMIVVELITSDMLIAVVASILVAAVLYIPRKRVKASEFCDIWINGFSEFIPALIIIVVALWMRKASSDLGLPEYVVSVAKPLVTVELFPMISFIIVSALGFITGSNWGIPAVCAPILIPLGASIGANLLLVMAAIVCGGTFCSHACFYSDATVITSNALGIDNMDHARTQFPYAIIGFVISCICYLIAGLII